MVDTLFDSYDIANCDADASINNGTFLAEGHSFTGKYGKLKSIDVLLAIDDGNPTGNIYIYLYTHSGTFGTSSVPTGDILAISDPVNTANLTATPTLTKFTFSGLNQYRMVEDEKYCFYIHHPEGTATDNCKTRVDANSPSHGGNAFYEDAGGFTATDEYDLGFYAYAEIGHEIISLPTTEAGTIEKATNSYWGASINIRPDIFADVENYMDIDGEEYIIKKMKDIRSKGKTYTELKLDHINSELLDLTIERFTLLKSVEDLVTYILAGTEWTVGTVDIDEIILLSFDERISRLEALTTLAEKCSGELYFHSTPGVVATDKKVDLKREIGTVTNLQLRYDKNSPHIEREKNSENLVTRLYVYGGDNITPNTLILDDCEDETVWAVSGSATVGTSKFKQMGSQGIEGITTALNETLFHDVGAGNVVDLSGYTLAKAWIYSETDNAQGVQFAIGETIFDFKVDSGLLEAGCWKQVTIDLSAVADTDKNAIRYFSFKNLTNGAASFIFDRIEAFRGPIYIDSANAPLYRIKKELSYHHSAKIEKSQFEAIIYPSDDSYISSEPPGNLLNYGSATTMVVKALSTNTCVALFKFPFMVIPEDATIISATFGFTVSSVFGYNGAPEGDTILAFLTTSSWNEETVTWDIRPTNGSPEFLTMSISSAGEVTEDIKTQVENWISGAAENNGFILVGSTNWQNRGAIIYSKESNTGKPYIKVIYSMPYDPFGVIIPAATQYLVDHEEPELLYKVNMADLSKVMVGTWENEVINIGDTVTIYDSELNLNVSVRVKRIVKDLVKRTNVTIELANRAYTIAESEALKTRQLDYAMPFMDNRKIINANAIQVGFLGSNVNSS